ncbi:MAG: GWxTD domain-containing protein [bacterium]
MTHSRLLRPLLIWLSCIIVSCFVANHSAYGFSNKSITPDSLSILFKQAIQQKKEGNYAGSETRLLHLAKVKPTFVDEQQGSVWHVLGKVLFAQNKIQQSYDTYFKGLMVLQAANLFDPYLADAFVRIAVKLRKEGRYDLVTKAFYQLLERTDARRYQGLLDRLYAQSDFFLPEALRSQFDQVMNRPSEVNYPGRILKEYWRSQDLTPATLVNERLIEHLQRVEFAFKHYASDNVRGFDDRGKIHVRFGRPTAKASAGTVGLDMSGEDPRVYYFRPHEVWSYRFLGINIFFPFVDFEDGRGYILVDRIDKAIPQDSFAKGGTKSQRGTTPEIDVRQYFYNQLAKSNPLFYQWVNELEDIKGDEVLSNTRFMSSGTPLRIRNIKAIYSTTHLDFQAESYRLDSTPEAASEVLSDVEDLPIHIQTARYLDEDGTTRLELFFGLLKSDLMTESLIPLLPIDTLLIKLAMAVEDVSFWPESTHYFALGSFNGDELSQSSDTLLFQVAVKTRQSRFFVSGQMESWLSGIGVAENTGESYTFLRTIWQNQFPQSSSLLKFTSFRTGLQKALSKDDSPLLMSDLQLSKHITAEAEQPSPHKGGLFVEPYPFKRVNRKEPIFLYFEIYGLRLSPEGQAHYRIAYEAEEVKTKRSILGKIKSIFGGRKKGRVELESDYTANNPNPREWIALDLNALSPGEIKLRAKVSDLLSGEKVERAITMVLF